MHLDQEQDGLHHQPCYLLLQSHAFGLKNTRATFQGLVNEVFKELFVNTMEVYIDNMLMKSLNRFDHVKHLEGSIPSPMKVQCEAQPREVHL